MKKLLLTITLLHVIIISMYGQDIIYKRDGTQIEAKVSEITVSVVKYKRSKSPNGPNYELSKSDLIKIVYTDGTIDDFTNEDENHVKKILGLNKEVAKQELKSKLISNGKTYMKLNGKDYTTEYNQFTIHEQERNSGGIFQNKSLLSTVLSAVFMNNDDKQILSIGMIMHDLKPRTLFAESNNTAQSSSVPLFLNFGYFQVSLAHVTPNYLGQGTNEVPINNIRQGKVKITSVDNVSRKISGTYHIVGSTIDRGRIELDGTFNNISY